MSIPTPFNPLGTLGGGWRELDMSSFVSDSWKDLAIASPPVLVPCGKGFAGQYPESATSFACYRSRVENVLFFNHTYNGTNIDRGYQYPKSGLSIPPRNTSDSYGSPAMELWLFGIPARLKVVFTTSIIPTRAYATRGDWVDPDEWETLQIEQDGSEYVVTTRHEARSVIIFVNGTGFTGTITKIYRQ